MRAIAEEAFALVREYKGSHSGEHGDGIVRLEFHEQMFGTRLVRAFEEVKDRFDPKGLLNPGKIVRAPKFDDRRYFRYPPGYRGEEMRTHLDWSAYPAPAAASRARSRCATTTALCRALAGGVMCPSYRVTRDERDVTRGRANTLRLAITGQLGRNALASDAMAETLKLCVSRKACRRECLTGVDMARMKIEVQAARGETRSLAARPDRRLSAAALCAAGGEMAAARQPAQRQAAPGAVVAEACRVQHAAQPAALADRLASGKRRTLSVRRTRRRSCSSPTPSTAISSRRTSTPRSPCWRRPDAASICHSRRTGRSAVAAPSWRSVWSTRRGARPSAASRRSPWLAERGIPVVV